MVAYPLWVPVTSSLVAYPLGVEAAGVDESIIDSMAYPAGVEVCFLESRGPGDPSPMRDRSGQ